MKQKRYSRRSFLRASAVTGAGLYFGLHQNLFYRLEALAAAKPRAMAADSPTAMIQGAFESREFTGDDVSRPHNILWDLEGYIRQKGGRPTSRRRTGPVVVGGGMAGLLSAYFLRDRAPVLLEQAPRFGGNSRGECFGNSSFSIGAAYITVPEENGAIARTLRELGLLDQFRHEAEEETRVHLRGAGLRNLWAGETDPAALPSAREVNAALKKIYEESYPEIPWSPGDPISWPQMQALDAMTAEKWLKTFFPQIHPHIVEYFQLYCWSSFGGSLDEISAAQFLNFVSCETDGVLALPGGNSAITSALHAKLRAALPATDMLSSAIVLEVVETNEGVEVLFETGGQLQSLLAPSAILATPKYVSKHLLRGVSPERKEIWDRMPYRAYVVVNVLLQNKAKAPAYDVFCLEGKVPDAPSFGGRKRPFADVVLADWAGQNSSGASVLTIYKPLPFEGARNTITGNEAIPRIRREIEQTLPAILEGFGLTPNAIAGVRVTRWGHAMPLAYPGYVASGLLEKISAPHGSRIFFANQDDLMNPAFESCFARAEAATGHVRSLRR